ncbi:hypothetical protein [Lyngbya confervoides]|uniref:Uncharacterized protein n=1 Tax=Lyngbya confervoides BDU141951 TaxID=1574623 RepID=A0ABD4T6T3_9CYAN|nr:hypothetical protein [Lyngbya confervoides]MCM1984163.1 hypothetical protein [Lyngbya confervoides BDU141951]
MQLEFIPVEEFYFALTLCCKTLEEFGTPDLAAQVQVILAQRYGQSSTVAAAKQNTFNYTFRVHGADRETSNPWIASVSDWQGKVRLSSDFGWQLNGDRKPVRTDQFEQRGSFCQALKQHLTSELGLPLTADQGLQSQT